MRLAAPVVAAIIADALSAVGDQDPGRLDFLKRRLVQSFTTVTVPFDDRIIFVRLLNCADFSSRLSEVTQAFDTISGNQFLAGGRGVGERWPPGTVRIRSRPGV